MRSPEEKISWKGDSTDGFIQDQAHQSEAAEDL
jgi:hypothetical protein